MHEAHSSAVGFFLFLFDKKERLIFEALEYPDFRAKNKPAWQIGNPFPKLPLL